MPFREPREIRATEGTALAVLRVSMVDLGGVSQILRPVPGRRR